MDGKSSFRVVFTGGSGGGKTSLCLELARQGYTVFEDWARSLISLNQQAPLHHPDWNLKSNFGQNVLSRRIHDFHLSGSVSLAFFDRGIPDSLAFSKLMKRAIDPELGDAALKYRYNKVFVLPPWEEIYTNDSIRKEDFKTSMQIYQACLTVYNELGYKPIEIPKLGLSDRASFVLDSINQDR